MSGKIIEYYRKHKRLDFCPAKLGLILQEWSGSCQIVVQLNYMYSM